MAFIINIIKSLIQKNVYPQIKLSYQKAVEILSQLFHGDAMGHITGLMESAVGKYDKFVKNLHLSLVKYGEILWNRSIETISNAWNRLLQRIEPAIIKLVQHIEAAAWSIWTEIFGNLFKDF